MPNSALPEETTDRSSLSQRVCPNTKLAIPRAGRNRLYTQLSIFFADVAALTISAVVAILARHSFGGQFEYVDYLPLLAMLPLFLVMFGVAGLYPGLAMNPVDELRRVTYASTVAYLVVIAGTFLTKAGALYSRLIFVGAWALSIMLVVVVRDAVRSRLSRTAWWGVPIVVLGAGSTGKRLVETLSRNPSFGLRATVLLDDDQRKHGQSLGEDWPPVLGGLDMSSVVAKEYGIRYAAVAMPSVPTRELARILHDHAHQFPHFLLIPDFFGIASVWVTAKEIGGVFGLEIQQNLIRPIPKAVKRAFDLILVGTGGLLLLPVFALITIALRLSSKGPALYSQKRIGREGKEFRAWKFRSMVQNADEVLEHYLIEHPEYAAQWARSRKLPNDPRVTRLGRILRKTSLDELPQLWNVLVGEMSLVGPRPIVRDEMVQYESAIELYLRVRPGITGLWQVSGRSDTTYKERVTLDEYYVRNWSVWLDIFVLGKTVKVVLAGGGAY